MHEVLLKMKRPVSRESHPALGRDAASVRNPRTRASGFSAMHHVALHAAASRIA
jgi:hypothetical protein